jgi:UDP-glucose-4-epimerase GalE
MGEPAGYNYGVSHLNILVTGGAGYIGSHTVRVLLERGFGVTVADNLSRGYAHNVDPACLVRIGLHDTDGLASLMRERHFDAVVHFAAFIAVGESMRDPGLYFANNVGGSLSLLNAMAQTGLRRIVFSSTAAVYGMPEVVPIPETAPIRPVNPYGDSKAMVERMLGWFDRIHGIRGVALRYFNASGADPAGHLGEEHVPETHLIPLALQAAAGKAPLTVFGTDYDTPDGTCIRDYIHVCDLAEAHVLALNYLLDGGASDQFNVGTGEGHSVLEVIQAASRVTGREVPYSTGPRREGDPARLVASSDRLRARLGWSPRYPGLDTITGHAWGFARRLLQASSTAR